MNAKTPFQRSAIRWGLAATLAAVLLAPAVAPGGFLESDYPDQRVAPQPQPQPEPQPVPRPRPVPVVDNPTTRLVRAVSVGEPIRWGGLVLFPLTLAGGEPVATIHSLSSAMDRGWVTIEEAKPAVVSRAVLVNRSDELVLVLAGELIKGGQQHRSSQNDLLLLGHSRVPLDLYCVEQGRWSGGGGRFESAKALAPQSVRAGNVAGAPQARVWEDVRSFNDAAGARSESQSLLAGLDSQKVKSELRACRRAVEPHLPRHCVGLVAGRGGLHGRRIFAADLFVDEGLFAAYRTMLIESYASEEVYCRLQEAGRRPPVRDEAGQERPAVRVPPPPGRDEARAYLDGALRARYATIPTPGGGDLWRISGAADGQSLDYRGQTVHAALSRQFVPPPRPLPPPVPMPEPMPRPRR